MLHDYLLILLTVYIICHLANYMCYYAKTYNNIKDMVAYYGLLPKPTMVDWTRGPCVRTVRGHCSRIGHL